MTDKGGRENRWLVVQLRELKTRKVSMNSVGCPASSILFASLVDRPFETEAATWAWCPFGLGFLERLPETDIPQRYLKNWCIRTVDIAPTVGCTLLESGRLYVSAQ